MAFVCEKCNTYFSTNRDFQRHKNRKTPCKILNQATIEPKRCEYCDKVYSRIDNLHRHQQVCRLVPLKSENSESTVTEQIEQLQQQMKDLTKTKQVAQTINIVNQTQTMHIHTPIQSPVIIRHSGWPAKWPMPSVIPRPFFPPSFEITPKLLEQAITNVGDIDGCHRGDIECVAKLGMECFKLLHADPIERNIYLNPSRSDQGLVYTQPSRWDMLPLQDALNTSFNHLFKEMGDTSQVMPSHVQATTQAVKTTFRTSSQRVIRSAHPSAVAHLGNLVTQLIEPPQTKDSWLGECLPFKISDLSWFCRESKMHIPSITAALTFETMLGVYSAVDISAESIPILAHRLPAIYARLVLTKHPENLTVIINEQDGKVFVHLTTGWEPMHAIKAAIMQIRAFAIQVIDYIKAYLEYGSTILVPVAIYLEEHLDEIAEIEGRKLELLTRYAVEAERYYKIITGHTLEEPRRLLGINWSTDTWTDKEIEDLIDNWVI